MPRDRDFMATAHKRFAASKSAWEDIRNEFAEDMRFVNVLEGQWEKAVIERRKAANKPALEFNELHTYVQQVVNRARQDRPQPKVNPGDDDASAETAQFLEGRLRHIHYASQADVAYDGAVEPSSTGGIGFYEITTEYLDRGSRGGKPTFNQEPRIKRILDPMTQYPDPAAMEPDLSDAKWWFSRQWMDRDQFRDEFNQEPVEFSKEIGEDWATEGQVCIAKYWTVKETKRRYVRLNDEDGTEGYHDEIERQFEDSEIENEREVTKREVTCDLIDGEKSLQTTKWLGDWIPIIPVLGREVVVDGKRYFISIVRFARGAQKLKNAYKSGIANLLGLATTAPWTGPKGTFKDRRWQDANSQNYATLEWDPVTLPNGQVGPPPERNTFEAPIQSLSAAAIQVSDDIKRAVGYSDAVLQPSKANDLSGVAVQRRSQQVDLTNFHFEDNLVRSQWHCARVVLDLDMKLADTPRLMMARKEDGGTFTQPVTMADEDGQAMGAVPGHEMKPHLQIDKGRYDVTISTGPTYNTRREEERDLLLQVLQANPQAWMLYGDLVFKLMGYGELEERARLTLPPQIQQAISGKQGSVPPQIQAQLAQQGQIIQQLKQGLQQAIMKLQTKQVEQEGRLHVERLKTTGALMLEDMRQRHDAVKETQSDHMEAIEILTKMLHESELAPDPNAMAQPGAPGAQPAGQVQ